MNRVQIKPLSVNKAWRGGARYRTKEYNEYRAELALLLPKIKIPEGKLSVHYRFGVSNKGQDYDSAIKQFQDTLQDVYEFNDNQIYRALIEKVITKKGEEFIEFEIIALEQELREI